MLNFGMMFGTIEKRPEFEAYCAGLTAAQPAFALARRGKAREPACLVHISVIASSGPAASGPPNEAAPPSLAVSARLDRRAACGARLTGRTARDAAVSRRSPRHTALRCELLHLWVAKEGFS